MSFNFGNFAKDFISGGGLYGYLVNKQRQSHMNAQNNFNQQAQAQQNQFIREQNQADKDFLKWQMANNIKETAKQYRALGINPLSLAGQTGTVTALQGTPQGAVPKQVAQKYGIADSIQDGIGMATQVANLKLLTQQMQSVSLDNEYKQYQMKQLGATNATNDISNDAVSPDNIVDILPSGSRTSKPSSGIAEKRQPVTHNVDATGRGVDSGSSNYYGYANTGTGLTPVPSKDLKENIEGNIPQEIFHALRTVTRSITYSHPKPDVDPGKNKKWVWDLWTMQWRSMPKDTPADHFTSTKYILRYLASQRKKFTNK